MSSYLPNPNAENTRNHESNFSALSPQEWPQQWHPSERFPSPQSVGDNPLQITLNERSFNAVRSGYRLGEPTLPVAPYREHIVNTVNDNQVSILSSETGSGKSSQAGLYLLEAGYPRVFVTQPRILAARELDGRARNSLGSEYDHMAGYLTGQASDSDYDPNKTKLIYVTEELLFKMANRGALRSDDVIIADEAHERTEPMIFLLGITKEILPQNSDMRLIVSSATINTQKFADKLSNPETGEPAPIMILPGRTHPIEDTVTSDSVATAARKLMKEGENVLAFESGIARQKETQAKMASRKSGDSVHLLYGDQTPNEQKKALNPEDHNHIVGNKIAETSITPVNKTAVVDSGLSNIGLYEAGKRVLKTVFSSQATMQQRRGRVGRTQPGKYTIAVPDNAPPPPTFEERDEYDAPPIEVSSVAAYIAELAVSGRNIKQLDLLENPTHENLQHDYKVLKRLGAIAVRGDEITLTPVGRRMVDLPLDVSLSRMLVEARTINKFYDVDPDTVSLQVAAAAAVRQTKGILDATHVSKRRYLLSRRNQENVSNEHMSDVLFELDTFIHLLHKQQDFISKDSTHAEQNFEHYMEEKDIVAERYNKAYRTFEELCLREDLDMFDIQKPSAVERQAIIGCQIAGADELFVQHSKTWHVDIRGEKRQLGRRSTISSSEANLVVGSAFDYRGLRSTGYFEKSYITSGTAVTTEKLLQHAPHRIVRKDLGHAVDKEGNILQRQALYFDGEIMFDEIHDKPAPTLATREFIIRAMMTGVVASAQNPDHAISYRSGTPNAEYAIDQWNIAQNYEHRSIANLRVQERYDKLISKIVRNSIIEMPLDVVSPQQLDQVIPKVYRNSLVRPSRQKDIPEIMQKSPDALLISRDEDDKRWLEVTYKTGIAYIKVPEDMKFLIERSDFADLEQHKRIKLKIDNAGRSSYHQIDKFFEMIEEQRNSPKRLKRIERREAVAVAAVTESTPTGLAQAEVRTKLSRKKPLELTQMAPVVSHPAREMIRRQRQPRGSSKYQKDFLN